MSVRSGPRRAELADFLRTRRERITPEQVGLPPGSRRRTPGLRREEVALLAGVGVTWYTWLEQGRPINASVQVLDSVARTLRMDAQERRHLLQLAGVGIARLVAERPRVSSATREILAQLDPFPAVVLSRRHDILAYNRSYNVMGGNLDAIDPAERNQLWLFFVDPYWRRLFLHRRETERHLVGSLRAAMAHHLDDPDWIALVDRLSAVSEEFASVWKRHEVADRVEPARDFASPVGDLHLNSTKLTVADDETAWMIVYSPRDESTRARLERLATHDGRGLRAV